MLQKGTAVAVLLALLLVISAFLLIAREAARGFFYSGKQPAGEHLKARAVIDRFEGDYAVVFLGPEEILWDIPRKLLPEKAGEGDWMTVTFELDRELTEKRRQTISELLKKMKAGEN